MSSADESAAGPSTKKRKLHRACDYCRNKKIKCDGPHMPNNRCSKCTARRIECTYVQGQNNSYPRSYVEDLEGRLERMEKLMSKLCPDTDISKELDNHQSDKDPANTLSPASEPSYDNGSRVETPLTPSTLAVAPPTLGSADNGPHSDEEEAQELDKELAEGMRKLSMHSPPLRYHGKSSGLVFIRSAMALKDEYVGSPPPQKRDEPRPWFKPFEEDDYSLFEESSFPPRDLMDVLVDMYFRQMNYHCPLLHEPTFKKSVAAGQHLRNGGFGATVLLVCAIGARFTRDPRVLLEDSDHPHSAGWKWFFLVQRAWRLSFAPGKLYDLQVYALMALFLQGSTAPLSTWSVIGAGIRVALDVGAHRKKMYTQAPTVEDELWRRAFWILVLLEWMVGYGLGRPSSIHDEDFDLALPTECDDEYWLTPEGDPLFKQPPGKPSNVTAFVCMIRLGQILAFAIRTIYTTNKSRAQLGQSDQQWEQRIVADLDSALNKWADSLPSHLRWNPEEENVLFLTQAGTLSAYYYYTQFAVHRPFIASSRRESPLSFPSVIICTNGARSCIQVLEVLYKRTGTPSHRNMGVIFMGGMVLMKNIFGLKRSGRVINAGKDLVLVRKAIEMLRTLQYENHVAESLGDMLNELVSAIDESLPPGARIPANAQATATNTTETTRPSSSAALSLKGSSVRGQHTEGPDTNRQPNPGDASNIDGTASSFTSVTPMHPSATLHMPPGFDFLQPNTLFFAFPFGSDGLAAQAAQGFPMRTDGSSMQHGPPGQMPPPPALPHEYTFSTRYSDHPLQPQPRSDAPGASANQGVQGQNQFDMAGGQMFGLEPLGFGNESMPSMSFLPSAPQVGTVGTGASASDYGAQQHHTTLATAASASAVEPGDDDVDVDTGMLDFALMDDALMMWSDLPPAAGWEDWGAYFADTNLNNAGT
ncbi:fungal-specific transcription factor domain-containing protein [Ganoderma leucocontextum]|nr:fungal-specific transcription factor domain-containing protein [Ganoderma leucocontextum]